MKNSTTRHTLRGRRDGERGMALVVSLLATAMFLALGMAVVMSTTTGTITSRSHRVSEQAFFAADAGINIARRSLAKAFQEKLAEVAANPALLYQNTPNGANFPSPFQVIPPPNMTTIPTFYQGVFTRAAQLATDTTRNQRLNGINGASFTVNQFSIPSGTITLQVNSALLAVQTITLRYALQVTGSTVAGGTATLDESGTISTIINIANTPAVVPSRSFHFSGFGAFFDNGDTTASSYLTSGTFTGPVHTNTHFAFKSTNSVTFRNIVSQVDNFIRVDSTDFTQGHQALPTADRTGINMNETEGYRATSAVPLPANNFSQEYAVINNTGITDISTTTGLPIDPPAVIPTVSGSPVPVFDAQGRVTPTVLAANLRTSSTNLNPTLSGGNLPTGVYIPSSNGTSISGAGIYVQGDAADIQLSAVSGNQVYAVTQGSTTTTITVNYSSNTTTVVQGSNTHVYTGVPTDKSDSNPANWSPAVSLFTNGSINSLRGGKNGSTNNAALASGTRLTITAQRNITVTGDLKYTDAVANSDGTPTTNINNVRNVLGLFTNDGNVNLAPNASYVSSSLNLEIDAAVADFNTNTANDGGNIEGSITYTGGTSPGSSDRLKIVGSRAQSKINNIGYSNRDVFYDTRFSGGHFSPPFFPGTNYTLGTTALPGVVSLTSIALPHPIAMSWFRENR